jgi:CBS domain-containing protein
MPLNTGISRMMRKRRLKQSEDYYVRVLLQKTLVRDVMTTPVISISQDEPFSMVEEKFRTHRIRHIPVIDEKKKVVGVISQRDLFRAIPPRALMDGTFYYDKDMLDQVMLKNIMIKDPAVIEADAPIGRAVLLMAEGKYGCVPVVDKEQNLCGILTQMDILELAAAILQE